MRVGVFVLILLGCVLIAYGTERHCTGECQTASTDSKMNKVMPLKAKEWAECEAQGHCPNTNVQDLGPVKCVNGFADEYPCNNVDLLSFLSLTTLTATGDASDIWGWKDTVSQREFAIIATYERSIFVDVTNAENPSVLGYLRTHTVGSLWRDIKVYKNHAFIISEATNHGMQVFDLTQLRSVEPVPVFGGNYTLSVPIEFKETAFYGEFGSCHNIAINEDSGFAYAVGSRTCRGGLHMVDISNPISPQFAGCFDADGYVHDTQCVNYDGPDSNFVGREICFCFDEDTLTIVDVTKKDLLEMISRTSYNGFAYTHQGWLLPGSRYLLLDDELDELYGADKHTRTIVWDVASLRNPILINSFRSLLTVIDHNLYTLADRAYLSNYCGGLRVYDTSAVMANGGALKEAGSFDVAPDCDTTEFLGSWSNYPYLPSGNIVVSSIERGLFVVKYNR
jgi:choice-of-anchor B domain-containing protein